MKRLILISAGLLGLSACVQVWPEPTPAPDIFRLDARPNDLSGPARADLVIAIAEPTAPRELSGARLVVAQTDGRITYVAQAQWVDGAPALLQSLWVETLERSGKVKAAVRAGDGVRAGCEIAWDLHGFEGRDAGRDGFSARVAISVKAVDPINREVRAQQSFESAIPAARGRAALAGSLGEAAREVVREASQWALAQGCTPES